MQKTIQIILGFIVFGMIVFFMIHSWQKLNPNNEEQSEEDAPTT